VETGPNHDAGGFSKAAPPRAYPSQDAAAFDSKAAAYEQYDRDMANAWRTGK
jgi:hypothetical protein